MNSISSAAPCHVRIGNTYYDVVCWTVDEYGVPQPWIVYDDGLLANWERIPKHRHPVLRAGTAREAVEDGR